MKLFSKKLLKKSNTCGKTACVVVVCCCVLLLSFCRSVVLSGLCGLCVVLCCVVLCFVLLLLNGYIILKE